MNILQPKYAKVEVKMKTNERWMNILQPKYSKVGMKMNEHLTT